MLADYSGKSNFDIHLNKIYTVPEEWTDLAGKTELLIIYIICLLKGLQLTASCQKKWGFGVHFQKLFLVFVNASTT